MFNCVFKQNKQSYGVLDLDYTFTPVYSESVFNKLKSHVGGLLETIVLVLSESFKASSVERVICILMFKPCSPNSTFNLWNCRPAIYRSYKPQQEIR